MNEHGNAKVNLATSVITLQRDGEARVLASVPGPPPRTDGLTIGAPFMTREPPHGGEMHPDGDEVLFLISGRITVFIEDQDPAREVELGPGEALVIPRGAWHRVCLGEPSQILHITPGPRFEHRPQGSPAEAG